MNIIGFSRFFQTGLLILSVTLLASCGSIPSFKDLPNYFEKDAPKAPPRDFITEVDLARVSVGMSAAQVKNRLGEPMLNQKNQTDRLDYVLKKGQGANEEFLPYAIYFKDQKVASLGPLTPPSASFAPLSKSPTETVVVPSQVSATKVDVSPPPPSEVSSDLKDAAIINNMLSNWTAAWSAKDVVGYLGFYANTFEHGKKSRAIWENQRRARLTGKEIISVSISDVQINFQSEALAIVKFKQDYSSNRFKDSGIKVLTLSKASGVWKIQSEVFQK
jgi:outer membrane protein assembly factor BamE (lipoprotein component of BamABCDE complex)